VNEAWLFCTSAGIPVADEADPEAADPLDDSPLVEADSSDFEALPQRAASVSKAPLCMVYSCNKVVSRIFGSLPFPNGFSPVCDEFHS
jgi:hypothetical protein